MVINSINKVTKVNFVQILTIIHNITIFRGDSFKYRKYCTPKAILVYCACPGLFHVSNLYETVPQTVFYPDSFKYYTGVVCKSVPMRIRPRCNCPLMYLYPGSVVLCGWRGSTTSAGFCTEQSF